MPAVDRKARKLYWRSEKRLIIGRTIIWRYLPESDLSPKLAQPMKIYNRKENKIWPNIYSIAKQEQEKALENTSSGQWLEFCRGKWLWMHQDRRLHEKPFWWWYILRAKSLFITRWRIGKLLGTIVKGGIAWKIPSKEVSFVNRCCQGH